LLSPLGVFGAANVQCRLRLMSRLAMPQAPSFAALRAGLDGAPAPGVAAGALVEGGRVA